MNKACEEAARTHKITNAILCARLDVNSNRTNPATRVRSFGDIKKKVIGYRYDRRLAEQGH